MLFGCILLQGLFIHAIAPARIELGIMQRQFGMIYQIAGRLGILVQDCKSDAGADIDLLTVDEKRAFEQFGDTFRHRGGSHGLILVDL